MTNPPNILVFMTDHQRGDTVLPEHPCLTPNLDRFGDEGVRFAETFCPSPHCCPSRATFMTGLYPSRHGVWNNVCNDRALSRGLADGVRLWSDDLRDAGYSLAWSGKWHVSAVEAPADRGWRELLVSASHPQEHGARWKDFRRVAENEPTAQRGEGQILRPGYGAYTMYAKRKIDPDSHDEQAVSRAISALDDLAEAAKPWAIYVGCNAPHDPYFAPEEYLSRYSLDDVPLPPSYADTLDDKPRVYRRMHNSLWGQLTEREIREGIRHYMAMCTYLDDQFGRLLAALDATGQADNTLVLYCADHGDYCGEHGLFAKGIPCFRGAYHVPAVVRWPAGIANPGRRVESLVSLADFGPTFAELAGRPVDESLTGRSLTPFLCDESPRDWRDEIHTQCNGVELYFTQRSVTTDRYKYVFNGFDDDELYDRLADPHEMTNLAGDPTYQPVVREMCRRMWRFAVEQDDASAINYITVSFAPFGPAEAFR